jgi:uncharacterized membrane protein HdeD (DUF308 family)
MTNENQKIITGALFLVAVVVGLLHHQEGVAAIFVFKNNEPISSWIFIFTGPLSTLPATIVAYFNKKIGGWWLILGGLISLVFFFLLTEDRTNMTFVMTNVLPMFLLGCGFLKMSAYKTETSTEATRDKAARPDR